MAKNRALTLVIILSCGIAATAQLVLGSPIPFINEDETDDSESVDADVISTITVIQPVALENRINAGINQTESVVTDSISSFDGLNRSSKVHGFRVQVFADNNQRSSQQEARSKAKLINERFPEYETYIVYNSPYWRLKVGDFKSEFEAETVADELKKAFPEFSREVRLVRDIVNVSSNKHLNDIE